LRVLDDGEVRPLGSTETRSVSLRFLAATNRDPRELLVTGILREDLYYRLRGLEIELPPLSERAIDVLPLALAFIGDHARRLSDPALDALARYPWPGNVRQLRSVLRSAIALAPIGALEPAHLLLEPPDRTPFSRPAGRPSLRVEAPAPASLRDLERQAILRTLGECGGNKSRTARALGIDRSTLRRKIGDLPDPG
jgi:DNA-binding NtrC family response regulator